MHDVDRDADMFKFYMELQAGETALQHLISLA